MHLDRGLSLCAFVNLAMARALFADEHNSATELQRYLDSLVAEDRLSGVVLVAKDGDPVASKVAGLANRETGAPITLDTKFNLGSLNKIFTAVAIAQLAQRGAIAFDDVIAKHLPDYPNNEVAQKITIHQLLSHTSGLGMYWNDKFAARRAQLTTVAAHLPLFVDDPPLFAPGEKFHYSNAGYIVLGAIIEKVSGTDYYDYVRANVFAPAGMENTGFYAPGGENTVALGYTRMSENGQRGETERSNADMREVRGGPAGGGYSTAADLVKFSVALRRNKLLDAEHTALVTTGKVDAGPIGRYAYGFGDKVVAGKHIVGHNGGAAGIAANLDMFPDSGYTAVVLMNTDPPAMMPVIMKLRELLPVK